MTLLELARKFDDILPEDLDTRFPIAQQMEHLLGDRCPEFEERYGALIEALPEQEQLAKHPLAETALREMGLAA